MLIIGGCRIQCIIGIYLYLMQSNHFTSAKATQSDLDDRVESNVVINKALDEAFDWVISIKNAEYGWGEDTPLTVMALVLSKPDWFHDNSLEGKLIQQNLDLQLMNALWKQKEMTMKKGILAIHIIAIIGLCKDPRSFYSKDLVAMMDHMAPSVHFEEAFGVIASCLSGKRMRKHQIRKIIRILRSDSMLHYVDTQSVALLALRCTEIHSRFEVSPYIREGIDLLMREQATDGSFGSNIHSTAIALQALIANGQGSSWNATKAQQYIISHQREDGSFGNLFDTNAALPILAGNSLLSVEISYCRRLKEIAVHNKYEEGMEYGQRDNFDKKEKITKIMQRRANKHHQ